MEPVGLNEPAPRSAGRTLAVVVHGLGGSAYRMREVAEAARAAYGANTDLYVPDLPHGRWLSGVRATAIVETLLAGIDARIRDGAPARIVLIGHSTGATLVRRLFLVAAGWPAHFTPEADLAHEHPRFWVTKVERIVMLAAFNRGWKISQRMSWRYTALFNLIGLIGHLVPGRTGWTPTAFDFRLGAPFMAQTRLHWLAYRRKPPPGIVDADRPVLIQLLGTQDDLVSPVDQVDLAVDGTDQAFLDGQTGQDATGKATQDYFLIEVPRTDHMQAIVLQGDPAAQARERLFEDALVRDRAGLAGIAGIAIDPVLLVDEIDGLDNRVKNTVFVIHGIRDDGFWTHRIAERVRQRGGTTSDGTTVFRSWTTSYGYFAMLPFVLPWIRKEKVEWFADQYVTAFAQYPESNFHYIGHSNGTYLAARALADYPAMHFQRVLFAGSVVRRDYRWVPLIDAGRVEQVQNLVAAGDWVVALLPKSVEWIPAFDLGGAGFDGFKDAGKRPGLTEFRYLRGGHGAGVEEAHWPQIADFIVGGTPFAPNPATPGLYEAEPDPTLAVLGRLRAGLAVVAAIALLACVIGYKAGGLFGLLVALVVIKFVTTRL